MNSLPHHELIALLSSCSCVITDSGGIQEEANFLGKHMYVLRKVTERQSIPLDKITLCTLDTICTIDCRIPNHTQGLEYGDGESCGKIIMLL
jgi:UDP-N-acetylglucosamine 2-epimerase